jgi:hypothetical protein
MEIDLDAVSRPIRSLEALGEQRQRGRLLLVDRERPCDDFTSAANNPATMS